MKQLSIKSFCRSRVLLRFMNFTSGVYREILL